jgi:arsenate reductase
VRALANVGIDASAARSKSVTEFLGQSFDYVVTVCDRARESCPVFPGGAESLHWGFDDPAEATGSEDERLAVFERVLGEISARLRTFAPAALRERDGVGA